MKIRTAIFFVYVAASALGFAVLMHFVLAEVRPRHLAAIEGDLQSTAKILAAAWQGRPLPDPAALADLHGDLRVRFIADDGRVLLDTGDSFSTKTAAPPASLPRRAARRFGDFLIDGWSTAQAADLRASALLVPIAGPRGLLVVSKSLQSLDHLVWTERKRLAEIGLLVAGIMTAAGWWIATRLTRSLTRLTGYVNSVREGKPAAPPQSAAKEISTLTNAFEAMRRSLEGRAHIERYTQALAHEVKAPLAAIRGAAELLQEPMAENQRAKFLQNIRGEAARIQQIIERLLELSSLEARRSLRSPTQNAATRLQADAAAAVRPAFDAAGVRLSLTGTENTAQVRGEQVLLREALVNLLQNSLEFSPRGTEVSIHCEDSNNQRVTWVVLDNGAGIPDYALPRVFERFYSLPRPGTKTKSTGLGLALVQEIAHLHGGGAEIANRAEGGVRAIFWIPLSRGG